MRHFIGISPLILITAALSFSACTIESEKEDRETSEGRPDSGNLTQDPPAREEPKTQITIGGRCVQNSDAGRACLSLTINKDLYFSVNGKQYFDADDFARNFEATLRAQLKLEDKEASTFHIEEQASALSGEQFLYDFSVSLLSGDEDFHATKRMSRGRADFSDVPSGAYDVRMKKFLAFSVTKHSPLTSSEVSGNEAAKPSLNEAQVDVASDYCAAIFADSQPTLSVGRQANIVVHAFQLKVFDGKCNN